MAVSKTVEVMYQNQLQFNLAVPLAASNIVSHYHKPCPIMVERVGGRNTIPTKHCQQASVPRDSNVSASSSFNYTMLSEDTMAKVSQMAKRDLKNRRLQMERTKQKSPSHDCMVLNHRHQPKTCARQRRQFVNKPRSPLRARESEKNRRIGNIQTPPPPSRKPKQSENSVLDESLYSNTGGAGGEGSRVTHTFFPVKPAPMQTSNQKNAKDEIGKLQQELESYLQTLCQIEQQVLREGSVDFLQSRVRGRGKNNYLAEEEDVDRMRSRAGEINARSTRNLYNLGQKVKQLQRDVSQSELSKPTKKSQITSQLNATYRGAVRTLQTFINQLPYQDLQMGLPSTYNELALLLRQLTTMMTLVQQGSKVEGSNDVLSLLDQVDDFNSKWCSLALQSNKGLPTTHRRAWVSDTKVDSNLLSKNFPPEVIIAKKLAAKKHAGKKELPSSRQHPKERKGTAVAKAGKENRNLIYDEGIIPSTKKMTLAGQKTFGFVSVEPRPIHSSNAIFKDIDVTKGYLLPPDLQAKREKAQRAVELSYKNFTDSTHSSRSKVAVMPRPSSAPSPLRKKEVNFDLREDKKMYLPWIPAGCAPCKPRQRSSSADCSPFYVRSMEDQDDWYSLSERPERNAVLQDKQRQPAYGYRSLPTERQLRSCDVSDSFVDLIEKRILYRMLNKKASSGGRLSRKDQIHYSSDEALDITDLTVDKSYDNTSLNTTAEAAGMVDAPTLENIQFKLEAMEKTRREIRQRWGTLKFIDTQQRLKPHINDCPQAPAAIDFNKTSKEIKNPIVNFEMISPINKDWTEEPLLFTKVKPTKKTNYNFHTSSMKTKETHQIDIDQGSLDRIFEDRDRLAYHHRKQSHHPTGKFNPWTLMEQISEEILNECMQEVSEEVEKISEEIANQMYKSEFMVTEQPSESQLLDNALGQVTKDGEVEEDEALDKSLDGHNILEDNDRLIYLREDYSTGREIFADEETPRSQASEESGFEPLLHGTASEPMLDNVLQLVQEKVESLVDNPPEKNKQEEDEEEDNTSEEDDDGDENGDNEDDYEDEYSEDDFEKVSDVEL